MNIIKYFSCILFKFILLFDNVLIIFLAYDLNHSPKIVIHIFINISIVHIIIILSMC